MKEKVKYISTSMATDWPEKRSLKEQLACTFLFFLRANPSYDKKMHLVKKWLIEFEADNGDMFPWREIALGKRDEIIFAGPSKRDYGFWLDSEMKFEDFEGEPIDKAEFELYWMKSGVALRS